MGKREWRFYKPIFYMKTNNIFSKGEIAIYKSPDGPEIEVKLDKESIWLDAHLIAKIFDVGRPAVVKHIHNIYQYVN